jgi:hypothetical protein
MRTVIRILRKYSDQRGQWQKGKIAALLGNQPVPFVRAMI